MKTMKNVTRFQYIQICSPSLYHVIILAALQSVTLLLARRHV